MEFDLKNILIGVFIGIISTVLVIFIIGDTVIEAEIELGNKVKQTDKDID